MTAMKQEQQPTPGARTSQAQPADQVRVGSCGQALPGREAPVRAPSPLLPGSAPTPRSPHPPSAPVPGSPSLLHGLRRKLDHLSALRGSSERMRKAESRGEGGREVKAGGVPGSPGGWTTEGGERWPRPRNGGLLVPSNAHWRNCCAPGGATYRVRARLPRQALAKAIRVGK